MSLNIRQKIADLFANPVSDLNSSQTSLRGKIGNLFNFDTAAATPSKINPRDAALRFVSTQFKVNAPTTNQTKDGSSFWMSGGYLNMPVQVPTDSQTSQRAVMQKAYQEFARLGGLSADETKEFVNERMQQNGGQIYKHGENPTPYGDAEFSAQAKTGSFAIYATEGDIAKLKAIKTREQDAAAGNAPPLAPKEAGIAPTQGRAAWDGAENSYLDETGKTVYGAASAYMEDQFMMTPEFYEKWGLPVPDASNQTVSGRAIGHTVSAVQAAAEIAVGSTEIGGGGLLDLSGIGAVVGVPAQVVGGVTLAHGALTGANTIHNIRQDNLLNQSKEETSGGKPTEDIKPEDVQPAQTAPQGKLEIEPGRTLSPQEQRIADKLVSEGKQVKAPKEVNQQNVKNPDFEVDGVKTELKTIENVTSADIGGATSRRIYEAGKQAPNIIVDVTNQPGMTKEIAENATKRAFLLERNSGNNRLKEVRMIGKDFDFTSTPPQK